MLITWPLPLFDVECLHICKACQGAQQCLVFPQIIKRQHRLTPLLLGVQGKQFASSHFLLSASSSYFSPHCHSEFDLDILLQSVKSNMHW